MKKAIGASHPIQPLRGQRERLWIPVETDQFASGRKSAEDLRRVSSQAQRSIEHRLARPRRKAPQGLLQHDRKMFRLGIHTIQWRILPREGSPALLHLGGRLLTQGLDIFAETRTLKVRVELQEAFKTPLHRLYVAARPVQSAGLLSGQSAHTTNRSQPARLPVFPICPRLQLRPQSRDQSHLSVPVFSADYHFAPLPFFAKISGRQFHQGPLDLGGSCFPSREAR